MRNIWKQILILFAGLLGGCILGILSLTNQANQQTPISNTIKKNKLVTDEGIRDAAPSRLHEHEGICEATRWKDTADEEYGFLANVVNQFASHGIQLLLSQGSLLGARRHFGIVPWDEQDVDFMVMSTNTTAINHVLDVLKLKWTYNNDGEGPGNTGFGYNIVTPFSRYVDFWLFGTINATHSACVGVDNGCKRWYRKYKWKNSQPPHFKTAQLACSQIPFGTWMFPSPHNVDAVLNGQFRSTNWATRCFDHKKKVDVECKSQSYGFVHTNGSIHTLKRGESVVASFSVKNGTYSLLSGSNHRLGERSTSLKN